MAFETNVLKVKTDSLPSILQMDTSEKFYGYFTSVFTGYSIPSGAISVAELNCSFLSMLGSVGVLGVFGLLGMIAGAYCAHRKVKEETNKIIRLHIELFLILNAAADKLEELQKRSGIHNPKIKNQNDSKSLELRNEYYDLIKNFQYAISSTKDRTYLNGLDYTYFHQQDSDEKVQVSFTMKADKLSETKEIDVMSHIVSQYASHRKSREREEISLWESVKTQRLERHDYNLDEFFFVDDSQDMQMHKIFGESGTFGHFFSYLSGKTYLRNNEEIPLNFDQRIHRGGIKPTYISLGVFAVGVSAGLFVTGKGLYVTAIALGAVAISSTGVGLVMLGIALALTLLSVYCYYKMKERQSDRAHVFKDLEDARKNKILPPGKSKIVVIENDSQLAKPSLAGIFVPVSSDAKEGSITWPTRLSPA